MHMILRVPRHLALFVLFFTIEKGQRPLLDVWIEFHSSG